MKKYPYKDIFQRNYGYYSDEEIKKIKKLRVAIAGAGGLGGYVANSLSRLGVGFIRIADPEVFEPHNLNRQFGSNINNIGKNKALVVSENCRLSNPYITMDTWQKGVETKNIDKFLQGVDVAIDLIEYFSPEAELALYEAARKSKIWVFTAQVAGSAVSGTAFDPNGVSFKKMFFKKNKFDFFGATLKMFPIFSKGVTIKTIKYYLSQKSYIPAYAMPAPIISNLIVEQLISKMIRKQRPIAVAPKYFGIDIHTLKTEVR